MIIDIIDLLVQSIRVIEGLLTVDLNVHFLHDLVYLLVVFISDLFVESLPDILGGLCLILFEHVKVVFGDDFVDKVILLVAISHLSELFDDAIFFIHFTFTILL